MEIGNELSSSLSFASSYLSNASTCPNVSAASAGSEPVANVGLMSLSKLSANLETLLEDPEYDYSDVEIVVENRAVGVHRGILAARSPFFHELFKKADHTSVKEGKPRYLMSELVPYGWVGFEAFGVVLNYMYTGQLKPSPPEVSTCVHDACVHDACGPSINYALQLMYASATFQMKELVMLVQRRLLNFVDKALVEDLIPILMAASHYQLNQLLPHCVESIARSDLDNVCLEKELPREVLNDIKSIRLKSLQEACAMEVEPMNEKRIGRILKALDSDDVELLKLLLQESDITLDDVNALHYAVAYCDPKVVGEVLNLGTVNLNIRNSRGYTVLHVAARRKDPSVIVGLLAKGACISDTTLDGQTAVTICRRLTRPKDYNEKTKQGDVSNKDRLCIDVLEREMRRKPMADNIFISSMVVADDLHNLLIYFENRVAFARRLFPAEARLAMEVAHADSTSEFVGFSVTKGSSGDFRAVDLNEIPSEQVKRLQSRLEALQKTVEAGRRFFPNCSEVLDNFLDDDMPDAFFLEKGTTEERRIKKMRFMELKEEVMKAFDKDQAQNNRAGLSSSSSSSSSPKGILNQKVRKR
ncbi:BTB/POZ domain and ankyrin repeat-containing protein NPR1-like [Actinidia eriantha]|uniref:BTB/POZ domain and ankyrin repeat-containing protein NPR1-like n=1 Tax=Actinidia eriantha TaxID=165200 RepID=UPI002587BD1A|nr:BTB/POZ domain and ankyrin repeat-containing protein NPR1-like [Actinidia eriantha]